MDYSKEEIKKLMNNARYPLSSKYNPDWILQNSMGSHSLWLVEALAQDMKIGKSMRVLDLGCGRAAGSIFMAREFGCEVWAVDRLNIATDNHKRAIEMDVGNNVYPICADAMALPFAEEFFDAVVSINSIFFYITDSDLLKEKILRYVKPGGQIGIIVPCFYEDYSENVPDELKGLWHSDFNMWHTLTWWQNCFVDTNEVEISVADTLPDNQGNAIYNRSAMIVNAHEEPVNVAIKDRVTFVRIIARRKHV